MDIDSKKLNKVAALMEEHGLTRVRISEDDGSMIELERMVPAAPEQQVAPAAPHALMQALPAMHPAMVPSVAAPAPVLAPAVEAADDAEAADTVIKDANVTDVHAPMVGVFYAAPSPTSDPFVTVGTHVHQGDTLCIIEAMKLMNEVVAECDGTISKILATDGELVEFGATIMQITPDGE